MTYIEILAHYRANNQSINFDALGIKLPKAQKEAFVNLLAQYCEDLHYLNFEGLVIPQKMKKTLSALQKAFCFNAGADLEFALEIFKDSDRVPEDGTLSDTVLCSEENIAELYSYYTTSYEEGKEYIAFFDNIRCGF